MGSGFVARITQLIREMESLRDSRMNFEATTASRVGLLRRGGQPDDLLGRIKTSSITNYCPALALAFLIAAFLGFQSFLPLGTAVKIGADEDYELAKATLCNHGYKLYTEIWNDQPPLVTFIIAKVANHAANPILAPRLLTVGFSVLLLAVTFGFVRALSGGLAASIATAMLIGSPGFLELSCSVMQEILAFASAVTALCVLWIGPRGRYLRTELLAGILFGFALQMKLIGVVYLPIAGLILWLRADPKTMSPRSREAWASLIRQFFRACLVFVPSIMITFIALNV